MDYFGEWMDLSLFSMQHIFPEGMKDTQPALSWLPNKFGFIEVYSQNFPG